MPGKKLVVIGGGAAGFFCAVNAARMDPGLQVTLLERSGKLLSKVRISGGGRCNVTHNCFDIVEMSRRYPRGGNFVKKAFHNFFTNDTIDWFKERGVSLKAEKDGRMFPVSDSSETIVNCLMKEAERNGVKILLHADVVQLAKSANTFIIDLADRRQYKADYVCVACGGYPKSSMFDWLKESDHLIEAPVPSLFTFNMPGHPIRELMGVSTEMAKVKIAGTKLEQEGPVLITHWGLSGPAILKLSAWGARELQLLNYHFQVKINWMPGQHEQSLKEQWGQFRHQHAAKKIVNHNTTGLPNRLWEFLLSQSGVPADMRFADLPAKTENTLIRNMVDYTVEVKGKTTFKEEFVTAGGVKLIEVDPNTMMSKKLAGLYFAGEILDVDGITGGYNFQHAWTSGYIAARSISSTT